MKKILITILTFFSMLFFAHADGTIESNISPATSITLHGQHFEFHTETDSNDNLKLLLSSDKKTFVLGILEPQGAVPPTIEAISTYKTKKGGQLLIVLADWSLCCAPQADGKLYSISIYRASRNTNGDITNVVEDSSILKNIRNGFTGTTGDGYRRTYKYQTIKEIKSKLRKEI